MAREAGWTVNVFERDRVGSYLLRWGHVRFFTPFGDNVSRRAASLLPRAPAVDALLTGQEHVEQFLRPLATGPLAGTVKEHTRVVGVSRRRLSKTELPEHPTRAERPFQLLLQSESGQRTEEANAVIDCTGVFGTANATGESGLAAIGESEVPIVRHLPDLEEGSRAEWLGQSVLLIGHGHSAATAVVSLAKLFRDNPETKVHWVVKTNRSRPCVEVANDPLSSRAATVQSANDLAEQPLPGWTIHRKSGLISVRSIADGHLEATIGRVDRIETLKVARILSLTGYRPDTSITDELQLRHSPVTGGTEGIAKALQSITDCLAKIEIKPRQLESGEEGFFWAGHKSYGRLNTFLLRTGIEHLEQIFAGKTFSDR